MMARRTQTLSDYIAHIIEAIDRVQQYTQGMSEEDFQANQMVQDAVSNKFQIMGEASKNIERDYPEFAHNHPELPLGLAYRMRNFLAHDYFGVDLQVVWNTIGLSLPEFKSKLQKIINDEEDWK